MNRKTLFITGFLLSCLALFSAAGIGCSSQKVLRVMAADSLTHSFSRLCKDFEKEHPDCRIILETQGSIMLSRMAMLRPCDVLAVADKRLIEMILKEETDWVIPFASTEIVLCWTAQSKYHEQITAESWPEILTKPDVRLGLANPSQDPCGYFTVLTWKLMETVNPKHHGLTDILLSKVPKEKLAIDSGKLLARLQSFNTDYAFAYKAQCEDMRLPYLSLPKQVNLGSRDHKNQYSAVTIEVPDFKGKSMHLPGTLVEFGVTIPQSCRNRDMACLFVNYLLSEKGDRHLIQSKIPVTAPASPEVWGTKLPDEITYRGKTSKETKGK